MVLHPCASRSERRTNKTLEPEVNLTFARIHQWESPEAIVSLGSIELPTDLPAVNRR